MSIAINLFGIGNFSKSFNLTSQKRTNIYYDIQQDADKTNIAAYFTPGTTLFSSISSSITRGVHWMESVNKFYVVQHNVFYEVSANGSFVNRGTLSTSPLDDSNRCSMANNGTQLVIFTGLKGYVYNTSTFAFAQITMPYGGNAGNHCEFIDGYFIVNRPQTGQFYKSALYDGTSWLGSGGLGDFATAESTPDNLITIGVDKGYIALLGSSSTELWADTGNVLFPFARVNGAPSTIGVAAEWSLVKINNNLTALTRNRSGNLSVGYLDGYQWVKISNNDIDFIFNNYIAPSDAVSFGYTLNGRSFYQITFQQQGASWLYDFQSQAWSNLTSWNKTRHIADIGAAFDTKYIVSDYQNGNLYILDANALNDNGQPIERELIGQHLVANSRNMISIQRLRVDMEGGIGLITGQGTLPSISLSISRDGGHTYGNEMVTTIGQIGQFKKRAEWRRLGQARDWEFKLRMTDPVKLNIMQAVAEGEELNK